MYPTQYTRKNFIAVFKHKGIFILFLFIFKVKFFNIEKKIKKKKTISVFLICLVTRQPPH